ncbi:MAG: cysteine desulfurase [Candidatus Levybacteria bacterium]|nr:cysteine desulfurase [Candidatus Levybacteria bacterium]
MRNYKKDFPIFNNKNLVYLDSAATSQKPKVVIDAISDYYKNYNANVHRGLYPISEKATQEVEEAREKIAKFINAKIPAEIIFTKNTTEAINLVAYSTSQNIKRGDVLLTTIMEHHSNFVPWQKLAKQKGARFEVLEFDKDYKFKVQSSKFKVTIQSSKLLAITQVSNVLGVINPIKEIIKQVRLINPQIKIIVDGAQSVPHMKVDVQELDCDFLAFSGHKMLAATGIGVLFGKKEILEKMEPFMFGGGMVKSVDVKETEFADLPYKFEAGTPDISGIISLGVAIDYLEKVGLDNIQKHEQYLAWYCLEKMEKIKGLTIYGRSNSENKIGVIAFNIKGIHAHDVAQILGDMGICVRAGHHCAMPLHQKLGISATIRASFYIYNEKSDVDSLIEGIKKVKKIFS